MWGYRRWRSWASRRTRSLCSPASPTRTRRRSGTPARSRSQTTKGSTTTPSQGGSDVHRNKGLPDVRCWQVGHRRGRSPHGGHEPSDGRADRDRTRRNPRGRRAGDSRRERGLARVGGALRVRAGRGDGPDRTDHRGTPRRPGRDVDPRSGQAAGGRGPRRGRRARRLLRDGGGRRNAAGGGHAALGRRRQARHALQGSARGGGRDLAVELALHLACGNAVVWAPAPSTSVCAVKLAECIIDAGLPPGLFNMITGQGPVVGDEVAANPGTQAVGFIGSIETGQKVASRAAGKMLLLEMGGNGPMVILDDADIEAAAEESLTSAFLGAGQSCTAGERFLVHERVYDAYLEELGCAIGRGIKLGDPFDPTTTLGPLNNEPTADKMDRHIFDALEGGAELVSGGTRAEGFPTDLYYRPTVLGNVTDGMLVSREETFGPIVPATVIHDEEQAVRAINSSPYGLLSAVFTRDLSRGRRGTPRDGDFYRAQNRHPEPELTCNGVSPARRTEPIPTVAGGDSFGATTGRTNGTP